jgi:WD40 repeat protein
MIHRFAEFTPAQLRNVIDQQRALIPAKAHNFIQTAVGFYTASHDRTVRIWDSRTGKPLLDPIKLPEKDSSACFALDETFFVTESVGGGTGNGEVQLWDTETGRELCEPIVRDMDQDVSVHSYTRTSPRRTFRRAQTTQLHLVRHTAVRPANARLAG